MGSVECTPTGIENVEIPSENLVVQKKQPLSFPDPSMEQYDTKPEANSLQQDGSCCSFSIAQVFGEATGPTADKQAGDGRESAGVLLPDGSAHALCENEENLLQSQTSANSPLNQVTGKRLMRSIRKVSEWLSRSKEVLSPISLRDVHREEVPQDLNPCMLDADFCVSQKTGQIEDQREFTMCHGGDELLPKLVASKIEDKIFGRTYRRERKSTALQNERDIIHIQAEECIAVNTKSCGTPREKTKSCGTPRKKARKRKATSELTPDDFIRRQDVKECRKNPVGDDGVPLEERDQTFAPVKDRPIAHQKDTELPEEFSIKEVVSSLEATGSGQAVNICHKLPESNLKNLKRRPNSLCKRSRQLTRPLNPLQFVVDGSSMSPEQSKIQIEDEAKEADTGQRQIRRSRRLQLLTEESWSGNKEFQLQPEGAWKQGEPAMREKKKEVDRKKKQGHSQAGNMPPHPVTENDPSTLQKGLPSSDASPMDIEDDGSKVCANPLTSPCVIGVIKDLSVEEAKEDCSPCFIAATAGFQGSCSLLQFPPTEVKQIISDEDKRFIAGQSENNALYDQTQESNGSCTGVVTEAHSPPDDKAAGTVELNPETDDNELDADFVQKIFCGCKRQSFLLHPGPVKEPANEIQGELKAGRVEDGRVDYLEKMTQNEERREAAACGANKDITVQRPATSVSNFPELENKTENLQLALQAPLPDHLSMPVQSVAKIGEGGNQLQSQKPTTERRVPPEMRENTSSSGSSRSLSGNTRSPSVLRNDNFQSSSLSLVNETRSNTDYFQEPESAGVEKKGLTLNPQPESMQLCPVICQAPLPQFSHVGKKRSSMDQKQLNSDIEEATDISSVGVPRCLVPGENLDQCTEEESHAFPLSLETPEGLLDLALTSKEGPPNLLESDREDISVVSSKIDEQPLGKDLDSSDRSSSMLKRKRFVLGCRRPVQKLPSSEEDDSSEEEKLPCFQALLFDTLSHSLNKNERSAEVQALMSSSSNHRPKDENVSPSQESECSVNLFSSQSHASADSCSKACDIRQLTPVSSSIEKLASLSENKKDTKPTSDVSSEVVQTKDEQPRSVDSESSLGTKL